MADTAVAKAQPSQKAVAVKNFQAVMNNSYYQTLLEDTLKESKGAFTTSLMELFTSDPQLLQCDPNALMCEAVKAAGLRLPINKQLKRAYITVFKNKDKTTGQTISTPTLIIGVKGYVELALRTNKYENINKGTVYEGEFRGLDKVTGALDISGEKKSDVPIGYFAYFKMKSGFEKIYYMTIDAVCKFAKSYAPTVKYSKVTWQELKEMAVKQSVMEKLEAMDGLPVSKIWQKRRFFASYSTSGANFLLMMEKYSMLTSTLLQSFSVMKSLQRQRTLSRSMLIQAK